IQVPGDVLSGAVKVDSIGPGIGHLAMGDAEIVRASGTYSHLAGEETAVTNDDMFFSQHFDSGAPGMLRDHFKLDAIHCIVRSQNQDVPAAVVGKNDFSLALPPQQNG